MDIYKLLGKEFKCEYCGKKHKIDIKFIEKRNIKNLPELISSVYGKGKKILVLCDDITYDVAGKQIEKVIKKENNVKSLVLKEKNGRKVTAKEEYLPKIEEHAKTNNLVITVGTGTITDLGKIAGNNLNIPVLCFPTASSMNAYTSNVAAYIKRGVKFTIPVKPVDGVFMDIQVIKEAPIELTKSGFADSLAKSFANSDWKISSIMTGEEFCSLPYKIVSDVEKQYIDKGDLIIQGEEKSIEVLMEGLNLGGISMMIAGKSSPASGGEHLISHFLDMYAHQYERDVFAFHGIQVASGIYISSLLYDKIKNINKTDIKKMIEKTKINYSEKYEKLVNYFPAGKEILKKEFENKIEILKKLRIKLPEKWDEIKESVFKIVIPPERIKSVLEKGKVPFHLKDIGVDENLISDDIILSRFIRARVTILDIADEIGILENFTNKYIGGVIWKTQLLLLIEV